MMKQPLNIVWFKRDLRIADHRPLLEAARRGRVLPLLIVEPAYWHQPDVSTRHFAFMQETVSTRYDNRANTSLANCFLAQLTTERNSLSRMTANDLNSPSGDFAK